MNTIVMKNTSIALSFTSSDLLTSRRSLELKVFLIIIDKKHILNVIFGFEFCTPFEMISPTKSEIVLSCFKSVWPGGKTY